MKTLPLTILFVITVLRSLAFGNGYTVSGTVLDSATAQTVPLATVVLKTKETDKIFSAINADADGAFKFEQVPAGSYTLTIAAVGYNTLIIDEPVTADINGLKIIVSTFGKTLSAAEVVAEKSLLTKNSEKTVFNVANSPVNQTGTAEDVLRNMPGVSVDQKGNVSVIGKQGVKVLVDGKPNALAQSDLPTFLKSIPANSIEAIELITNPSAKYDAEGNAGIINIRLKKGKSDGLNGSISAGYGILNHYNGSAIINYRKNKINVFADYGVNYSKAKNEWIEKRIINFNDTTNYYNFDSKGVSARLNNNLKAGIDYTIDDKNSLTYTAGGNYGLFKWNSDALADNLDGNENKTATYNSADYETSNNYVVSNDVAFTHKFDTLDHQLDIDIAYTYVHALHNTWLNSSGYDSTGAYNTANSLLQRTAGLNKIHNVVVQLDYQYPFKKLPGYKLEAGIKNELTTNENTYDVYQTTNNTESYDSLLSNKFYYTENIAAAYFMLSGGWKKLLSYSAGLRAEHTYIQSNTGSVNKNYISLFPSATIGVAFNEMHNLSLSYSRRVQRPQFRQINNTISYVDQYTTWQGNAYLLPSFSNLVSLNYTIMVKQHMFSFDANGNFETNVITETSRVDSNRITRGGVSNSTDSKTFNLSFYTKLQLTKWWDLQMSHTYSYAYYAFKQGVNTSALQGSSYNLWASTSFKFWKNCVLQIGGWFNSRSVGQQGYTLPVGMLNASIKKSFFKEHLTVSVAGNNLINSMKFRWNINNSNLHDEGSWQEYNRVVMISLTYNFGSNKPAIPRKEKEGNERLNDSGGR
ncbi:MAG TPA: outer membrane beta-barrel protein [Chitinophagales bacterium]|nr:outer membrane beta-barrel protein [Chitinophagales bacterium]